MIERKQKRMAGRRKEKVRGSGRKPREATLASPGCKISLRPFSSYGTSSSFFVRFCKVFLAGILPRDSAGAPACPRDSSATVRYHIYLPLRCFVFCRLSLTYYSWLWPLSSNLFPTSFSPLLTIVYQRCLRDGGGGGNEDDGGSSWWRRVPEFQTWKL